MLLGKRFANSSCDLQMAQVQLRDERARVLAMLLQGLQELQNVEGKLLARSLLACWSTQGEPYQMEAGGEDPLAGLGNAGASQSTHRQTIMQHYCILY